MIHADPQYVLHTLQEIFAVLLEVKAEEIVPQQALHQLSPPGADPVHLPGRPGDMPEVHDGEVGDALSEVSRGEGQVVILDPDGGGHALAFLGDRLGEALVRILVMVPVGRLEHRPFQLKVAEGPQRAVREAIIEAPHLGFAEPDPA
jgi:hypothetical protein